jgi:hypothetical protein
MAEVLERPPKVRKKSDQLSVQKPPKYNVVLRDLAGSGLRCHVTILMDVFKRLSQACLSILKPIRNSGYKKTKAYLFYYGVVIF